MKHLFLFWTVIAAITISACINPLDNLKTDTGAAGTVTVSVARTMDRTLRPDSARIESYTISGAGPAGAVIAPHTNPNGTFSFSGIIAGNWTFTIDGLNASEEIVASGSVDLTIAAGLASTASVSLKPLTGTGMFSVQLAWPAEQLVDQVGITLNSLNGESVPVSFILDGTTAQLVKELNTGSYLASVHLLREGKRISRQLDEAVQIFRDHATSWEYEYTPEDFRALYTVTYHANGAEGGDVPVDTNLYYRGDTLEIPGDGATLSRSNYTFSHWNTQADGQGTAYYVGDTLTIGTASVDLYARFLLEQCTGLTPPADSATNADWPTLGWDVLAGAVSYEVQIVNTANGLESLEDAPLIPSGTNSLATSASTAPVALYWYWRVRGVDASGDKGEWSDTVQITVGWYRHNIVLEGPEHDITTTDTTPLLHWAQINGTIRYEMQMATTLGTVESAAISVLETESSWIADDAMNNKTDYFWRIRAVATDSVSGTEITTSWSTIRKFRVQWGLEGPAQGIRFPKELALLATDTTLRAGNYVLSADLDLSSYANWTSIGTSTNPFTGTLDGNGHTITGLKTTGTAGYRGLFGYTGSGSHIKNLSLTAVDVRGGMYTGALIGFCEGNVTNCNATGTVTGSGGQNVGGLIGRVEIPATGTGISIINSWANCTVTSTGAYVGGLIGALQGRDMDRMVTLEHCSALGNVSASSSTVQTAIGGLIGDIYGYARLNHVYATGTVTGSGEYAGGLVGRIMTPAVSSHDDLTVFISNAYATGNVAGRSYCGGLVGSNGAVSGTARSGAHISYSYATGNVSTTVLSTGMSYMGGLVGWNGYYSIIQDSYARGTLTGNGAGVGGLVGELVTSAQVLRSYSTGQVNSGASGVRGLIGRFYSPAIHSDCYYDRETSGRSDTGQGSPQYTTEMKTQSTFAGWDFTGNPGEGIDPVWAIDPVGYINDGYPYLTALMP